MVRSRPVNPSYRYSAAASQFGAYAQASIVPEVYGEAHHSACSAAVQVEPVVFGDVNFLAFSGAVVELDAHGEAHHSACVGVVDISPEVMGAANPPVDGDAFASAALVPSISGIALRGLPAQAAISVQLSASAVANYVYLVSGDASIQPVASGVAYRPAVLVNAAANVMPTAIGYAIRGTSARAATVIVPQVATTTFRVFYCSTDTMVDPNVSAFAEFTPSFKGARCSAGFLVTPIIAGMTNA